MLFTIPVVDPVSCLLPLCPILLLIVCAGDTKHTRVVVVVVVVVGLLFLERVPRGTHCQPTQIHQRSQTTKHNWSSGHTPTCGWQVEASTKTWSRSDLQRPPRLLAWSVRRRVLHSSDNRTAAGAACVTQSNDLSSLLCLCGPVPPPRARELARSMPGVPHQSRRTAALYLHLVALALLRSPQPLQRHNLTLLFLRSVREMQLFSPFLVVSETPFNLWLSVDVYLSPLLISYHPFPPRMYNKVDHCYLAVITSSCKEWD